MSEGRMRDRDSNATPLMLMAWVVLACAAAAGRAADPNDIPVIGRPVELPFSEASAGFVRRGKELIVPFEVVPHATPRHAEVEQPIIFTVTVTALGPVRRPPVPIDLNELPSFKRSFFIETLPDGEKEKSSATSWRWVYRLKARRAGIDEIPRLPFAFYNPDLRPVEKAFQVIWTDPVALVISPAERNGSIDVSDRILRLKMGPAILADARPWAGPTAWLLAVVAAVPPLICGAWYMTWRRLYPDAARRAQLRRSRAARRVLASLATFTRLTGKPRAEGVARAVVGYLRERFDLPMTEPTPEEAAAWLRRCGLTEEMGERVRRLLTGCAIERFGPDEAGPDVVAEAGEFITEVEERPCPQSS